MSQIQAKPIMFSRTSFVFGFEWGTRKALGLDKSNNLLFYNSALIKGAFFNVAKPFPSKLK